MKELNIEAPEGYEIDNDKSDLSKGIVRFKKINKKLTYVDVCNLLFLNSTHYYVDDYGVICVTDGSLDLIYVGNEADSREQLESLLALNKLKNVANYLNDGWKHSYWTNAHTLKYSFYMNEDKIVCLTSWIGVGVYGLPVFKSEELAKQAIEILGEDVIKKALLFGIV